METKRKRSEIITDFMNLMEKECTSTLPYVVEQRIKCDKATQDLLHQLELGDYKDRGRIATQLAHIRRDRRYYKDIEEEIAVLDEWYKNNSPYKQWTSLKETLGALRKVERYHENREYIPRIIKGEPDE